MVWPRLNASRIPTDRMVEFYNSIGLLIFSKYAIRILKPIKNMVADKPYEAISSFMLANAFGASNVLEGVDNIFNMYGNPISLIMDNWNSIATFEAAGSAMDAVK